MYPTALYAPWDFLFIKDNGNVRAYAKFAFNGKLSFIQNANMLDDGKPQTRAARLFGSGFIHAVEPFAKARQVFLFNADPPVRYP